MPVPIEADQNFVPLAEQLSPGGADRTALDAASSHVTNTGNPHNVTKAQIGLGNVDNTSDANKPISTAQQAALDAKFGKDGSDAMTGDLDAGTHNVKNAAAVRLTAGGLVKGFDTAASHGGDLIVSAGDGVAGNQAGGTQTLKGGFNNSSGGDGGNVIAHGAAAGSGNTAGGALDLYGGAGGGSGARGDVNLQASGGRIVEFGNLIHTAGNGSPEGVVTGPVSSVYHQKDAAGQSWWVKESGSGNTGWVKARWDSVGEMPHKGHLSTDPLNRQRLVWDSTAGNFIWMQEPVMLVAGLNTNFSTEFPSDAISNRQKTQADIDTAGTGASLFRKYVQLQAGTMNIDRPLVLRDAGVYLAGDPGLGTSIRSSGTWFSGPLVIQMSRTMTLPTQYASPLTGSGYAVKVGTGAQCYLNIWSVAQLYLPGSFVLNRFTVDFFYKHDALTSQGCMFFFGRNYGLPDDLTTIMMQTLSNGAMRCTWNGASQDSSVGVITTGTWQHFAASWDGTNVRFFVDGNVVKTIAYSGNWPGQPHGVDVVSFGVDAQFSGLSPNAFGGSAGYIAAPRIRNVAAYTANFTPHTAAPVGDNNTLFLTNFLRETDDPLHPCFIIHAMSMNDDGSVNSGGKGYYLPTSLPDIQMGGGGVKNIRFDSSWRTSGVVAVSTIQNEWDNLDNGGSWVGYASFNSTFWSSNRRIKGDSYAIGWLQLSQAMGVTVDDLYVTGRGIPIICSGAVGGSGVGIRIVPNNLTWAYGYFQVNEFPTLGLTIDEEGQGTNVKHGIIVKQGKFHMVDGQFLNYKSPYLFEIISDPSFPDRVSNVILDGVTLSALDPTKSTIFKFYGAPANLSAIRNCKPLTAIWTIADPSELQYVDYDWGLVCKPPKVLTALQDGTTAITKSPGDNSTKVATTAYADAAAAAATTSLLELKGSTDCSANPNYPTASKGDAYIVSVAGKIGGASGVTVNIGDEYFATADNVGGTQASVGTSWDTLVHSGGGSGQLLAANNLSDVISATTSRSNLGLATVAATGSASDLTGTLGVGNGGTGLTSYAVGDLIYASGSTTLAKLADVASGSVLVSGGVGVAPSWNANPTITGSVTVAFLTLSALATTLSFASGGNQMARDSTTGRIDLKNQSNTGASWRFTNTSGVAGTTVVEIRGHASQSNPLTEWQSSGGTTVASMSIGGVLSAAGAIIAEAGNVVLGTSTGTKIGTATGQKLGFWNATPVVQQVLATGASHTVDDVIAMLQTLGLCKQS